MRILVSVISCLICILTSFVLVGIAILYPDLLMHNMIGKWGLFSVIVISGFVFIYDSIEG